MDFNIPLFYCKDNKLEIKNNNSLDLSYSFDINSLEAKNLIKKYARFYKHNRGGANEGAIPKVLVTAINQKSGARVAADAPGAAASAAEVVVKATADLNKPKKQKEQQEQEQQLKELKAKAENLIKQVSTKLLDEAADKDIKLFNKGLEALLNDGPSQ